MSAFEDIVREAIAAPPDRQQAALRLLRGELSRQEPYLTLRGLSREMGLGVTTLRRWQVPGHQMGGAKRYRVSEVEDYLASEEFRRRQAALRAERRQGREVQS